MNDKKALGELAEHAGGWQKLAQQMWPLLSANKKNLLKRQLTTPPDDPLMELFKKSCAIKINHSEAGRPHKYNALGVFWVWQALEEMKRLGIGTSRIDRLKKIICYVTDPNSHRITGLPQSMKDRLRESETRTAVPKINLQGLADGQDKPHTAITTYSKHINDLTPWFKKLVAPYRSKN